MKDLPGFASICQHSLTHEVRALYIRKENVNRNRTATVALSGTFAPRLLANACSRGGDRP
jgi:hypothetical protein